MQTKQSQYLLPHAITCPGILCSHTKARAIRTADLKTSRSRMGCASMACEFFDRHQRRCSRCQRNQRRKTGFRNSTFARRKPVVNRWSTVGGLSSLFLRQFVELAKLLFDTALKGAIMWRSKVLKHNLFSKLPPFPGLSCSESFASIRCHRLGGF